jgi:hypothetical protein
MSDRASGVLGLCCACAGAVVWAWSLALLQPLTEPAKPWHDAVAENNTYWARDVRWMAIVAVFAGLVLAFRGERRRCAGAAVAAAGLIGADLVLDRLDVTGWPAAGVLAAVVCVLLFVGWVLARPKSAAPHRVSLVLAATVAAATVPVAAGIESPTDTEAALTPAALTTGWLLVAVAAGCAAAAAPLRAPGRLAAAGVLAVVGGAGVAHMRVVEPGYRGLPVAAWGVLLLIGVGVVVYPWKAGLVLSAIGMAVGYPVLLIATLMVTGFLVPVAALFTAAAGNPPVNAADTDLLLTLVAVVPGLILGGMLALVGESTQRAAAVRAEEPVAA